MRLTVGNPQRGGVARLGGGALRPGVVRHLLNARLVALGAATALLVACAGLPAKLPRATPLAEAPIDAPPAPGGIWPERSWWRVYRDPTLDRLVGEGLAGSPSLAGARRRFESARAAVRVAGAAAGARVDLQGSAHRQRLSDNGLFPPRLLGFNWYNQADLGLRASYTFDWWGRERAAVAAAADEARVAAAERADAALTLEQGIAEAYFGWQADQQRLAIAREELDAARRDRRIAAARVRAGLDSGESVRRADLQVATSRATIAALSGSARLRVVALAALVGRPVSKLPPLVPRALPVIRGKVPADVRVALLARRPDVAASRWRVEAARQDAAAARAAFYPDISVDALAGLSSIDLGKLLEYGSRVPQAGVALDLPIFDSGLLRARFGASRARLRAAVAGYDATVVGAARDVATQAATLDWVAAERRERRRAVDAAQRLRDSAAARVRRGLSDARPEIAAEQTLLAQRDFLAQLDAAAVSADVALRRALGGGYGEAASRAASAALVPTSINGQHSP
ncbi:MAG: efflux transporter outer membrane subunit [Gammaproteobacteria bacterium]|nr:efflux transporter outer membrane subunit [Gammaproteobacteria bacterium]